MTRLEKLEQVLDQQDKMLTAMGSHRSRLRGSSPGTTTSQDLLPNLTSVQDQVATNSSINTKTTAAETTILVCHQCQVKPPPSKNSCKLLKWSNLRVRKAFRDPSRQCWTKTDFKSARSRTCDNSQRLIRKNNFSLTSRGRWKKQKLKKRHMRASSRKRKTVSSKS